MSVHEESIALARCGLYLEGADARAGDGARRVWIQVARVGQWAGHPSGRFSLSAATFAEIVRNFRHNRLPVPIDFEHASELDPRQGSIPREGAPAVGWIHDLDNRGSRGLWALVEWLDVAREHIRAGRYRFISPTIRFGARDRETGKPCGALLSSAGLTNQPFLTDMQPLAASSRVASNQDQGEQEVININIEQRVERLIANGFHPERARAFALRQAATDLHRSLNAPPSEIDAIAEDVRGGRASIVQLADKIQSEHRCSRDTAFSLAERKLRAG